MRRRLASAPPGPPILVTGTYRSGTTWVGAMLAAAGLWPLHEPFNPNQGLWAEELAYLPSDRARPDADRLVRELLRGRHRRLVRLPGNARWFTPLRRVPYGPRRVLVKDPSAALLSEYLVRRHGMRAVVLFRHPAAVVSSIVRLGWPTTALVERLRASPDLRRDWLADRAATIDAALERPGAFAGAVLCACVTRVLDGYVRRNPERMVALRFEDLCAAPEERFRALHDRLGLLYDADVRAAHAGLTAGGSAIEESRPHGVVRRTRGLAERWRGETTAPDLATIRAVWEEFDLPLYREPSDWVQTGDRG